MPPFGKSLFYISLVCMTLNLWHLIGQKKYCRESKAIKYSPSIAENIPIEIKFSNQTPLSYVNKMLWYWKLIFNNFNIHLILGPLSNDYIILYIRVWEIELGFSSFYRCVQKSDYLLSFGLRYGLLMGCRTLCTGVRFSGGKIIHQLRGWLY